MDRIVTYTKGENMMMYTIQSLEVNSMDFIWIYSPINQSWVMCYNLDEGAQRLEAWDVVIPRSPNRFESLVIQGVALHLRRSAAAWRCFEFSDHQDHAEISQMFA
uniref:F-box associated domain-containing protein n=1 Tax=Romanomermis culicivorax TaxID=13658 RepID=A0A915KW78_ROMCU